MTTIVAERVTDTGVCVGGEWWNFSKFGQKPNLQEGATYEVEYKEFKGKKYISKARQMGGGAPVNAAKESATAAAAQPDYRAAEKAKGNRILAQGIVQACLHSPGLVGFASDANEYLAAVEAAAEREIKFVLKLAGE